MAKRQLTVGSKITSAKEGKKEKERARRKKRKKNNGCTLSFCIGFLRDFSDFDRKKLLDGRGLFDGNVFKTSARDINILFNLHNSTSLNNCEL